MAEEHWRREWGALVERAADGDSDHRHQLIGAATLLAAHEALRAAEDFADRVKVALEDARHALVTVDGLEVVDMAAYGRAQEAGADANGAWDALCESGWTIDETKTLTLLDAVLPPAVNVDEPALKKE